MASANHQQAKWVLLGGGSDPLAVEAGQLGDLVGVEAAPVKVEDETASAEPLPCERPVRLPRRLGAERLVEQVEHLPAEVRRSAAARSAIRWRSSGGKRIEVGCSGLFAWVVTEWAPQPFYR
jgi:hypothetical protein